MKYHNFIHIKQEIINDMKIIRQVYNSQIVIDANKAERLRLTISENCFTHKWDNQENSFYFQRCYPIEKKCLILLDIVMNKFITVDEKKTPDMQEYQDDEQESDDIEDTVTVTSRVLQNYGVFFEKHLPLHKLAWMPRYCDLNRREITMVRPAYPDLRIDLVEER